MSTNSQNSNLAPRKRSIPTVDVLSAAIGRLNRQSIVHLLEQLGEAIDSCCDDDLSPGQIQALVRGEIQRFEYSKELDSLVNLIRQEIDRFDFGSSQNTSLGSFFQTVFENYDYHQSSMFNLAIDGRISNYNYGPFIDARIANYNFAPLFEKYVTIYDFRKANDSFTIALNNYLAGFDFLNLTNNSFTALVDSHIAAYDFRKSNNSFHTAVETRLANYDFREVLARFLRNYDFNGFVSPSLDTYIDNRIKSGSMTTHAALLQFFQTTINKFDFSASINITNVINAAIANYSFNNHVALTQVFNTRFEEYDFSNNVSLRLYLQNNNNEIRNWIDVAIQPIILRLQSVDRVGEKIEARIEDVQLQIKDVCDAIDVQLTAINSLRLAFDNIQNLSSIKTEIQNLQQELEHAVALAGELDEHELGQVRKLFFDLLGNEDSAALILSNLRIRIHDQSRPLLEIIQALDSADQVVSVSMEYPDEETDPRFVKGCSYVLTDGTSIHFDCIPQAEPEGILRLEFRTADWKGIQASFASTFVRRSTTRRICKREVTFDWYDPIESTNIVFAL